MITEELKKLSGVMTVDTGWHTGVAIWHGNDDPFVIALDAPVSLTNELGNFCKLEKMSYLFSDLLNNRITSTVHTIILEKPELWFCSNKSMVSATKGDLFTLAILVGCYAGIAYTKGITVKYITAKEWKGQLTKAGTMLRIQLINGQLYSSDHIADAVGIGFAQCKDLWSLKHLRIKK